MGLLKKLTNRFGKNNQEIEEVEYNPELEDTGLKREDVDMHDKKQRENYVKACLEQLAEASKELESAGLLELFELFVLGWLLLVFLNCIVRNQNSLCFLLV